MKHPCDIYKVARQCGVILREGFEHSPTSRKPRECFCKPTLREIGQDHGEDHLRLVLMLMTGTRVNAAELYADMIKAVSRLMDIHPAIQRARDLTARFDEIDLGEVRILAKKIKGMPVSYAIFVLLYLRFYEPLNEQPLLWHKGSPDAGILHSV